MHAIKNMFHGGKTHGGTAAGSGTGAGGTGTGGFPSEGPICGQITVQVVQGGVGAMIGGTGPLAGQESLTTAAGQAAHIDAPFAATTMAGGDPDAAARRTSGFMVGGKPGGAYAGGPGTAGTAGGGYGTGTGVGAGTGTGAGYGTGTGAGYGTGTGTGTGAGYGTGGGGMAGAGTAGGPGSSNLTLDFSILSVSLDWSLLSQAFGFSGPSDSRFSPIVHIHTAGEGGALLNKTHALKLPAGGAGGGMATSTGMGMPVGGGPQAGYGSTGTGTGTGIGAGGMGMGGGMGGSAPLTFNARNLRVFAPPSAPICLYLCDDKLLRDRKLAIAGPLPASEWLRVSTLPLRLLGGAGMSGTGTGVGTGAAMGTGTGVGTGVSTGMGTGSGYGAAAPMTGGYGGGAPGGYGAPIGASGSGVGAPLQQPMIQQQQQQPFIQQQQQPLQQPMVQQQQPAVVTQGVSQSVSDASGVSAPTAFGSVKPISGVAPSGTSTGTGGIGTQPYGSAK